MDLLPPHPPVLTIAPNALAVKIANTHVFGIQVGTYETPQHSYAEVLHCAHGTPRISYFQLNQITYIGNSNHPCVAAIPRVLPLVRIDSVPVV